MKLTYYILQLLLCAVTIYLIRVLPLTIFQKKIQNRFFRSLLFYIPPAAISAMLFPAVFYATGSKLSAMIGFAVAVAAAFFNKSLATVALLACAAVFLSELILL